MRDGAAGFTLIEVLVALALFALIGGAGVSVLDQVLRTQSRTEGQLDRLAAMQRAMHLVTLDFSQAATASVVAQEGVLQVGRGGLTVGYAVRDGVFVRNVAAVQQPVLPGVEAVAWTFLDGDNAWVDAWPMDAGNPQAIALTLTLPRGQEIRRVVALPADPE